MKLRWRFLVAPIALALLPVFMNASVAATKAGSSCAKVGSTSISSGKKFTCIKVGKKLVWNNGVVQKSANKPSPQPSKTPAQLIYPTSAEILKIDQLVARAITNAQPAKATIDFQVGPGSKVLRLQQLQKQVCPAFSSLHLQ